MKYADSRGIKTRQWFTNEMLRQEDINRIGEETYQNAVDMLMSLSRNHRGSEVLKGLDVTLVTGLTAVIKAGIAVSHSGSYLVGNAWGFVADPNDSFVVVVPENQMVAFDDGLSGGGFDRIDIVEIRPVQLNSDSFTRNFKDPITGLVSTAIVPTGLHYSYEMAVRKGAGGVTLPVPPSVTSGWVKIAEVRIPDGATTLSQGNVVDAYDSHLWKRDSGSVSVTMFADKSLVQKAGRALTARDLMRAHMGFVPHPLEAPGFTGVAWNSKIGFAVACINERAADHVSTHQDIATIIPTSGMVFYHASGISPTGATAGWESIAYSPALDCMVCVGGSTTAMMYSFWGPSSWLPALSGLGMALHRARWDDSLGIFIIAGTNIIVMGDDVPDFSASVALTGEWRDIVYSPELDVMVAVAYQSSNNVAWSDDHGATWTIVSGVTSELFLRVEWSPDNGKFIAITEGGTFRAYMSEDGKSWEPLLPVEGTSPHSRQFTTIRYIEDIGMWLAMGNGWISSSVDAHMWWGTTFNTPVNGGTLLGGVRDFVWISDWGTYVAVTATGEIILPSREASRLWGMHPSSLAGTSTIMARDSAGRAKVAAPSAADDIARLDTVTTYARKARMERYARYSDDDKRLFLSRWLRLVGVAPNGDWRSVCWSPELGKFVAVSYGTAYTMSSSDGINWINSTAGVVSANWSSVCWSPELGKFVAVAYGSANTMSSSDGVTWVVSSAGVVSANWDAVCWSPELGKFVAVSSSSANTMSSLNGVNWVNSTAGVTSLSWTDICWSPELGKFVAVAGSTSTMYSSDGVVWDISTSGVVSAGWRSVCWSPELGKFVAVAYGSANTRSSSDGVTWVNSTSGAVSSNWTSVCWSPELMRFVAVSTVSARVMTSSDGVNWITYTVSADWTPCYSVCWSPELGRFVAVSDSADTLATYDEKLIMG